MIAWVFPGQGSQFPRMGASFQGSVAQETFAAAREILGWDVRTAESLDPTEVSQPAIFTVSVAAARTLRTAGLQPDAVAGHSVGEFAALVAAGAIEFEEALRVVERRGRAMGQAGRARPGSMAAVVGLDETAVEDACRRAGGVVGIAAVNTADQIVISGEIPAVHSAGELARAAGARRVVPLDVAVAAHSPLMADAVNELRDALASISVRTPDVPFISCVSGERLDDPARISIALADALVQPVRWVACVRALRDVGADQFIEAGPGNVVSGLTRRAVPDARVATAGSDADVDALATRLSAGAWS